MLPDEQLNKPMRSSDVIGRGLDAVRRPWTCSNVGRLCCTCAVAAHWLPLWDASASAQPRRCWQLHVGTGWSWVMFFVSRIAGCCFLEIKCVRSGVCCLVAGVGAVLAPHCHYRPRRVAPASTCALACDSFACACLNDQHAAPELAVLIRQLWNLLHYESR